MFFLIRPVLSAIYMSASAAISVPDDATSRMTVDDARMLGEICVGNKNTLENSVFPARETLAAVGGDTKNLDALTAFYSQENQAHAAKLEQHGYSKKPCLNLG